MIFRVWRAWRINALRVTQSVFFQPAPNCLGQLFDFIKLLQGLQRHHVAIVFFQILADFFGQFCHRRRIFEVFLVLYFEDLIVLRFSVGKLDVRARSRRKQRRLLRERRESNEEYKEIPWHHLQ